jgi:PhnB protein
MPSRTPPGYGRLAPWVISSDTAAELAFLAAAFGARETPGSRIMNGSSINHVEVEVGDCPLLLFDAGPGWPPTPSHLRVYVADVEQAVAAAVGHGGRVVTEPTELAFGDVVARVRDGQGHLWWVHQHVEDVGLEEMGRRFAREEQIAAMAYVGATLREEMLTNPT